MHLNFRMAPAHKAKRLHPNGLPTGNALALWWGRILIPTYPLLCATDCDEFLRFYCLGEN